MRILLKISILIGMALTLNSCLVFLFTRLFKEPGEDKQVICSHFLPENI